MFFVENDYTMHYNNFGTRIQVVQNLIKNITNISMNREIVHLWGQ